MPLNKRYLLEIAQNVSTKITFGRFPMAILISTNSAFIQIPSVFHALNFLKINENNRKGLYFTKY
ncbi:hypothetical protein HZS_4016 [Henneguya salminicola]|nr:hypothetical protein HZS_4016 [Henneguya salminicola]